MNRNLILFFTRGVSLKTWHMMGMLGREIGVYNRLVEAGWDVSFITYGDREDVEIGRTIGKIKILANVDGLPLDYYQDNLNSIHKDALAETDIIKTNQTFGAELALKAAKEFNKPLIARCGYMWSKNAEREHSFDSPQARLARETEQQVFTQADRVFVTTHEMKLDVVDRMPHIADRVRVIPNYVDTAVFAPRNGKRENRSLLFIGRIAPEKNLKALLRAVAEIDAKLVLIGEGRLRPELQQEFAFTGDRVLWEGNVPNIQLPDYINEADIFVLPSLYEGHPKALIEAMSCATAVIGCDSPGVRDVIQAGVTGRLSGTDAVDLKNAIEELLDNSEYRSMLGRNARQYVLDNYSLDKIAALELSLLEEVIEDAKRRC